MSNFLILASLITTIAFGQNDTDNEKVGLEISGSVLEKSTKNELSNVNVSLHPHLKDSLYEKTTSDESGDFELSLKFKKENVPLVIRIEAGSDGYNKYEDIIIIKSLSREHKIALQKAGPNEETIPINDIRTLQKIGDHPDHPLDGHYKLTSDIDASQTEQWNNGKGFDPIGNYDMKDKSSREPFTGILDGNGHTIDHLHINRQDKKGVGLLAYAKNSTIKDLELKDVQVWGDFLVGGLVGLANILTKMENIEVSGKIHGGGATGGITGHVMFSKIGSCRFEGAIIEEYQGGFPGGPPGALGGVVGSLEASHISNTTAKVKIKTGKGAKGIGGLVGVNEISHVTNGSTIATITGEGWFVGGIIGINKKGSTLKFSRAEGKIVGALAVGGLIGSNNGYQIADIGTNTPKRIFPPKVELSYFKGNVTGEGMAGGIVGENSRAFIENCYAIGKASGQSNIGGIVGLNQGIVRNVYASVIVKGDEKTGGLMGAIKERKGENEVKGDYDALFTDSYWNSDKTKKAVGDGTVVHKQDHPKDNDIVKGLTMYQLTGNNAEENMPWLDFKKIWKTTTDDLPALKWEEAN